MKCSENGIGRSGSLLRTRSVALTLALSVGLAVLVACANDGDVTVAPVVSTSASSPPPSTVSPTPGAGPSGPPCGIFVVDKSETVAGQHFPKGRYQIHAFGISCEEVIAENGLLSEFLMLDDDAPLPEPWRFLEGAVGAPKFVAGPSVGFRVQRISP